MVFKYLLFIVLENNFIVIVGVFGSGKLIIVKFILWYWDVILGEIMIGGINIKDIELK